MRVILGALLMLCIFSPSAAAAATNADWLADYRALKTAMERDYANLAWFGSPQGGVDLPRLDRRVQEALSTARTMQEARAAVRTFVEAFDDGHFSILPPPPVDPGPAAAEPARPALAGMTAERACAALGYGNRSQIAFSLPFESLPGFALLASYPFRIGILRQGGLTVALLRIRNFSVLQFPDICETAWETGTPAERADDSAFGERVQAQWMLALARAIDRLKTERPDALVVDIGTNSGGNDSGEWAPRLFTAMPLRSAPLRMTSGSLATRYLDEEISGLEQAVRATADEASRGAGNVALATMRARRTAAATPNCTLNWVWSERRRWSSYGCTRLADVGFASGVVASEAEARAPDRAIANRVYWPSRVAALRGRWSGSAYVLTNGATYSAAEMFAAVLQNNRAAKVVGATSGGDGCGFMIDAEPLTLPHLGMRIRMPNCVRLRPDGSNEVAGIVPDLPVLARDRESPRARAGRLIATIIADRQGSR